jgi:hypothetical protein
MLSPHKSIMGIIIILALSVSIRQIAGHGRLMDPPSRSSIWTGDSLNSVLTLHPSITMTISYFVVDLIKRIILERIVEFVVTLLISRGQGIMKLEVNTTILATSPGLITLHR